jgi:hypothetical protein
MPERQRIQHTCARCGRIGYNAFQASVDSRPGAVEWICSHEDPCRSRRRTGWRRSAAQELGRNGSSQLRFRLDEGMTACVIGADGEGRDRLAAILSERTALPPKALGLTPRGLGTLVRGRYCLIVIDVSSADPIAYHNELARRLRSRMHRDLPIVLCCADGHDRRPPLSWLADLPNVTVLRRPFDARRFVDGVEAALLRAPVGDERYS